MNILLVEDNERISDFMVKGLEEIGYSVTLATDGTEGRRLINEQEWTIILLDIMLPEIDGLELLQYTRFKKINTPILVLSALNQLDDKVKALDFGADDYLAKPFHFKELVARIKALTRRSKMNYTAESNVLKVDNLVLNMDSHKVVRNELDIQLTLQEFKLLKLLLENLDKVCHRTQILDRVWGIDYDTNTNIVDVYISYLRNKIDIEGCRKLIETVKGRGYIIRSTS